MDSEKINIVLNQMEKIFTSHNLQYNEVLGLLAGLIMGIFIKNTNSDPKETLKLCEDLYEYTKNELQKEDS